MKCRGCGKDTDQIYIAGIGWMHWQCQINRLDALRKDLEYAQAERRAPVERGIGTCKINN